VQFETGPTNCVWADPFPDRVWAIESARGLGYLLAQQLVAAGETVSTCRRRCRHAPDCWARVEGQKNDPNDARSVAITAMRVDGLQRVTAR
jgi:transposase